MDETQRLRLFIDDLKKQQKSSRHHDDKITNLQQLIIDKDKQI